MEHNVHVFTNLMIGVHVCLSSTTVDPNMCGEGLCCSDYRLDGNRCIECSPGKYKNNCSEECTDGFYGLKCRKNCPSECNNTCDKVSGVCPGQGQDNSTLGYNFEEKLATFVKDTMWMIIGVSLISVSFSCIGAILFCKIRGKKEAVTRAFHNSDQNSQQLNGLRYESDSVFSNNSSTLQLPPRVHESNTTRKDDAATRGAECEYSKSKKRYSLVRRIITLSREMMSNSEYSDDNDDMYNSDEFDDSFDAFKNVQISDLPRKDSLKTFQSEHIKSNEAYGKIWL